MLSHRSCCGRQGHLALKLALNFTLKNIRNAAADVNQQTSSTETGSWETLNERKQCVFVVHKLQTELYK